MAKKLNLVEALAGEKLFKKLADDLKKSGEEIEPGSYPVNFSVDVDGTMSRAVDTEVTPTFKMDTLLKAVILKYAETLEDPRAWLESLLSIDGALGAVIQLGPNSIVETVPHGLVAIWKDCEAAAKAKHRLVSKKSPRKGNTTVAGEIVRAPNQVVRSMKKK